MLETRIHQCPKLFVLLPLGPNDLWQSAQNSISELKEARIGRLFVRVLTLYIDSRPSSCRINARIMRAVNSITFRIKLDSIPDGFTGDIFRRSNRVLFIYIQKHSFEIQKNERT